MRGCNSLHIEDADKDTIENIIDTITLLGAYAVLKSGLFMRKAPATLRW